MPNYATWNPADLGSEISLSGGNLTVIKTTTAPWDSARCNQGKSTGKHYFEIELTDHNDVAFGFGTIDSFLGDTVQHGFPGYDVTDISWGDAVSLGRQWHLRDFTDGILPTLAAGEILRVKADLDDGNIWLARGGDAFNPDPLNPVNINGKTVYPIVSMYYHLDTVIANFGESAFSYDVPDGYNAGWYEEEGTAGRRRRMLIGRN